MSKLRSTTGDWAADDDSHERKVKLTAANKARKFHVDPALSTPEGTEKIRKVCLHGAGAGTARLPTQASAVRVCNGCSAT